VYAVKNWHYSRSLPPPPRVSVGVWEGGQFVGVVLFARGATGMLLNPYGLKNTEGAELVRVALTAHHAPVSRIVRIAISMLRRLCPGLRLLVSFADPDEGHHGGIYQAMGWTYAGQSAPSIEYIGPRGQRIHARMVSPKGYKRVFGRLRRTLRPENCKEVRKPGKFRYLLPLDYEMRGRIQPLAKPYPKRPKDQAPALQAGLGGETPTRPLQLSAKGTA
jgi:hypothetical protein